MKLKATTLLLLPLGIALFAAATPPASLWQNVPPKQHLRANPVTADPDTIAAGENAYHEHCQQCHRADARGDDRHASLRTWQMRAVTDGDIEWYLRQGDRRNGMPSWAALTQKERWQLVAYVRSLQ